MRTAIKMMDDSFSDKQHPLPLPLYGFTLGIGGGGAGIRRAPLKSTPSFLKKTFDQKKARRGFGRQYTSGY